MDPLGLPIGTVLALAIMILVPIGTFVLYLIDKKLNNGRISILGVE